MNYSGFGGKGRGQFRVRFERPEVKITSEDWNRVAQEAKAASDFSSAALIPTARCRPVSKGQGPEFETGIVTLKRLAKSVEQAQT